VVPASNFAGLPKYKTPREAATLEQILIQSKDVCDVNIERLRAAQTAQSPKREATELSRQVRRVIHFLMTGEDSTRDAPLSLFAIADGDGSGNTELDPRLEGRSLVLDGDHAAYCDAGRIYRRYSPMVARLAPLCCGQDLRVIASAPR
jgi:hypothetical protein